MKLFRKKLIAKAIQKRNEEKEKQYLMEMIVKKDSQINNPFASQMIQGIIS